jgi:NAD(P)-dependent dehydrogenase (short-subunit alcohol dehydrogenase family)
MIRSLESQRNPADTRVVHDANSASTPTGRYATPGEVANVVMYLCSDLASDITGTHLVIDGGRSGSGGAHLARVADPSLKIQACPYGARLGIIW